MTKTHTRRSTEQQVADLEARIAAVKQRAEAKQASAEVQANPAGVAFLAAVKAADRAIRVAAETQDESMGRALEAARAPLAQHLVALGVRLPDQHASRKRKLAMTTR